MNGIQSAFTAGLLAAVGTAVTLLVHPTFIESDVTHAVLDGLFVGATVYIGMNILDRTVNSE